MKVLLVDDHVIFREGLSNLLAAHKFDVVGEASDGLEAFEKARALRPDVILMDIQMPRCDGLSATRLIKAELPEIQIVMLTMLEDEENLFEAIKSGASGYMVKRSSSEEFLDMFASLEDGLLPFSPGIAEKLLKDYTRLAKGSAPEPSGQAEAKEIDPLTDRQIQVITLVAQGKSYKQISEVLGLSERTIKYHMTEIYQRLHLDNRAQVIGYAARFGIGANG
jgi:DNA-binding NarL/FixJ family response regulator